MAHPLPSPGLIGSSAFGRLVYVALILCLLWLVIGWAAMLP
ncbi:Hypothetical protein NGAL_HAMBI1146_41080 [Neorhizobium galegae bv. officinalis]|nr:hypothetical protein [Neorhizobium galegae]CDZ40903.1 Hypothetical protein NGAL_HAMBI1146_41080 [Neorhizobium galegae bv. officinalis]